jgi:hypothetical protein
MGGVMRCRSYCEHGKQAVLQDVETAVYVKHSRHKSLQGVEEQSYAEHEDILEECGRSRYVKED